MTAKLEFNKKAFSAEEIELEAKKHLNEEVKNQAIEKIKVKLREIAKARQVVLNLEHELENLKKEVEGEILS